MGPPTQRAALLSPTQTGCLDVPTRITCLCIVPVARDVPVMSGYLPQAVTAWPLVRRLSATVSHSPRTAIMPAVAISASNQKR